MLTVVLLWTEPTQWTLTQTPEFVVLPPWPVKAATKQTITFQAAKVYTSLTGEALLKVGQCPSRLCDYFVYLKRLKWKRQVMGTGRCLLDSQETYLGRGTLASHLLERRKQLVRQLECYVSTRNVLPPPFSLALGREGPVPSVSARHWEYSNNSTYRRSVRGKRGEN